MSPPAKRKRGRPRLTDPQVVDGFFVDLINAYKSRPILYDSNHPKYRVREYLTQQWLEIAEELGSKPSIVKTRFIWLRNRWNIEKRRIEKLEEENGIKVKSDWPIYPLLEFLSEHRKPRGSYLTYDIRNSAARANEDQSADFDDEDDEEDEDENDVEIGQHAACNGLKNYDSIANNNQQTRGVDKSNAVSDKKYKTFGKFLTAALLDMPERDALVLVQNFTTQLIWTMTQEHNNKTVVDD